MRLLSLCLLLASYVTPAHAEIIVPADITHAYAKPSLEGVSTGVVFLTLTSAEDDKLVAVSTPAAGSAEIHDHISEGGVMRMRKVDGVALKKGEPVAFKPGGLHVMLFNVKQPLKEGDTIALTFTFEKQGNFGVSVPVQSEAPGDTDPHAHHHH